MNLAVELDATAILRAHGYAVVDSRTQNATVVRIGPGDTDGSLLTVQGVHDDVAARDIEPYEASLAASAHGQRVLGKALSNAIDQFLTAPQPVTRTTSRGIRAGLAIQG